MRGINICKATYYQAEKKPRFNGAEYLVLKSVPGDVKEVMDALRVDVERTFEKFPGLWEHLEEWRGRFNKFIEEEHDSGLSDDVKKARLLSLSLGQLRVAEFNVPVQDLTDHIDLMEEAVTLGHFRKNLVIQDRMGEVVRAASSVLDGIVSDTGYVPSVRVEAVQ